MDVNSSHKSANTISYYQSFPFLLYGIVKELLKCHLLVILGNGVPTGAANKTTFVSLGCGIDDCCKMARITLQIVS